MKHQLTWTEGQGCREDSEPVCCSLNRPATAALALLKTHRPRRCMRHRIRTCGQTCTRRACEAYNQLLRRVSPDRAARQWRLLRAVNRSAPADATYTKTESNCRKRNRIGVQIIFTCSLQDRHDVFPHSYLIATSTWALKSILA